VGRSRSWSSTMSSARSPIDLFACGESPTHRVASLTPGRFGPQAARSPPPITGSRAVQPSAGGRPSLRPSICFEHRLAGSAWPEYAVIASPSARASSAKALAGRGESPRRASLLRRAGRPPGEQRRVHHDCSIQCPGRRLREFSRARGAHYGRKLAELMTEHEVRVASRPVRVPKIDSDYFEE
jgi:hypothetical protein